MNQSMNTSLNGDQLANDIWAMLGATSAVADNTTVAAPDNQTNAVKQSEMSNIPDLATEILSKLEQKKGNGSRSPWHLCGGSRNDAVRFDRARTGGHFPEY